MKIKKQNIGMLISIAFSVVTLLSNCKKEEVKIEEAVRFPSTEQQDSVANPPGMGEVAAGKDSLEVTESSDTEKDSITLPGNIPGLEQTQPPVSKNAYNIEQALPKGYVKDGSVDYTNYLQYAINNYTELVFPGFPILVNDTGIKIPSNRTIYFSKGSELRLEPSSKAKYDIIRIELASNVNLIAPRITGDRYQHTGTTGEWGNGIGIYSAKNVTISDAIVVNCWGDGIYIGSRNDIPSENIRLTKPYCKNNRRDGISIINVNGLEITDSYTGFSDGTAPFCGINIEPDNSKAILKNIVIERPLTEHNIGNGIQIGLSNLYGPSNKGNAISISIIDHVDVSSFYACKISNIKPGASSNLQGSLTIKSPVWKYSKDRPLWMSQTDSNLEVYISKPQVIAEPGSVVDKLLTIEKQLKFGLKSISIPYILSL